MNNNKLEQEGHLKDSVKAASQALRVSMEDQEELVLDKTHLETFLKNLRGCLEVELELRQEAVVEQKLK